MHPHLILPVRILRYLLTLGVVATLSPDSAAAQRPALVRPLARPQRLEILNIFRFYHVVGNDTIGGWVHDLSTREERWSKERGDTLRVEIVNHDLTMRRPSSADTLQILSNGRILTIGGRPSNASTGPIDWFPRLPVGGMPLRIGATWSDTLILHEGEAHIYDAFRRYTVRRRFDTLGVKAFEVVGTGTLHFRMTSIQDSTTGDGRWWDVSGPVVDTFWIDPAAGRYLGRKWDMKLLGRSAPIHARGGDTTDAGLPSRETVKLVSDARYSAMIEGMPEGDTLYSIHNEGLALVHTHRASGDTVREGMSRMDGMFGSNTLRSREGVPVEGWASWVDSLTNIRQHYQVKDGKLAFDDGTGRPLPEMPEGFWGVADYAMDGMLVPALMKLPGDSASHQMFVYRPWPAKWDELEVIALDLPGGRMITMTSEDGKTRAVLLGSDGSWLASFETENRKVFTVPPDRSPLMPKLQALIAELQRANGR